MKKIFIMALLCAIGINANAQWSTTGTVTSTSNTVGIGTNDPQGSLDIFSAVNTSTTPLFSLRSDFHTIGNYGMIRFGDYTQTSQYQKGALIYESVAGSARGKFHIALENTDGTGSVNLSDAKFTVLSNGNIGIGTPSPSNILTVNASDTYMLINRPATNHYMGLGYSTAGTSKWFIGLREGGTDRLCYYNYSIGTESLSLLENGNFGIESETPLSKFQVDDGCTKASIGEADGADLNFGTSYLGFNAARNKSLKQWTISTDQVHNGGGVIYSNIQGEIYFAPIASTGTTDQTLYDTDIKNKITFRVSADGTTYAKKIKVELTAWPDYVFGPKYTLMPLTDVKSYIDKNHHLPDMPSATDVEKNGLDLGEMNKLLTKKVEELTLYLIEKDKEAAAQKKENMELERRLGILEKLIKQ